MRKIRVSEPEDLKIRNVVLFGFGSIEQESCIMEGSSWQR